MGGVFTHHSACHICRNCLSSYYTHYNCKQTSLLAEEVLGKLSSNDQNGCFLCACSWQ